jgi:sugar-specific transcriptional regulator TrmB
MADPAQMGLWEHEGSQNKLLRHKAAGTTVAQIRSKGDNTMSKIREIRESIDTKLDKWEATVTAVEAQLQQTKDQALEEFEVRKKQLNEALKAFKSEVVKAKGLADGKKTEILALFEDLPVQLALGKAEVRDSFEAQKEKIRHSIATLETTIDHDLDAAGQSIDESLERAANKFIVAAIGLEAEMEALEIQFKVEKAGAKTQLEHKKKELIAQINRYKSQLDEKKQMAKDKATNFESELSDGMSQIIKAFKKLFD